MTNYTVEQLTTNKDLTTESKTVQLNLLSQEGIKHDEGKLRYDLIPLYPLEKLAEVYTIGAEKYADNNWRKGMAWMRIFRALLSHAFKWARGQRYDRQDGQQHLASVAWCAFALMEYEHYKLGTDNRYWHDLSEYNKKEKQCERDKESLQT